MTTPSKADVLKVAGEPVAWLWETAAETGIQRARPHPNLGVAVVPLYTETKLLAMYAAGIESAKSEGWRQCAVGQHTSQFCGQLEVEKAKAYAKGAEDMRERAALACDEQADEPECQERAEYCADAIRALPITPTNTESEHDKAGCRVGGRFDWVEANLTAEREVSDKLEKALTGILGWIDDWCETSDGDFQTLELAADAALAEVAAIRKKDRE